MRFCVLATVVAGSAAHAGAAEPGDQLVFLGLRPTAAPAGDDTDVPRIAEAQRLRVVAEGALELVS